MIIILKFIFLSFFWCYDKLFWIDDGYYCGGFYGFFVDCEFFDFVGSVVCFDFKFEIDYFFYLF